MWALLFDRVPKPDISQSTYKHSKDNVRSAVFQLEFA